MKGGITKLMVGDSLVNRVFHAAGIGLALIDGEGCFLRVNPALQGLLQVSEEDLQSMSLRNFCAPQDACSCYDLVHEVAMCGSTLQELELSLVLPNDSTIWVHVTASPVLSGNGTVTCIVLTVHDSSDYFEVQEAYETSLPQNDGQRTARRQLTV